jgi:LmeA-like phospholipid-binding
MTTPPQRPGQPGWPGRGKPPDPATRRPPPLRRPEPPTEQFRARRPPADAARTQHRPPHSPADAAPTEQLRRPPPPPPPPAASAVPGGQPPAAEKRRGSLFRHRQSIILIAIITVALLVGGAAGAELYARHRADNVLVGIAECVVQDDVNISYGVNPPFLWQHITGDYTNISVSTAGDRVQDAKGMTADVTLADVRLKDSGDSKGTIGSLDVTLTWKSEGIKDTVVENLPGVGNLVSGVSTKPGLDAIVLEAGENSVTAKPVVTNGDLNLEVIEVNGPLPKETVQTALNDLTKKLNDNYPLGIQADSVAVTETGVVGKFSSQNASIPKEDANPCFERL